MTSSEEKRISEDVLKRITGKKLPPDCPHCGKRLYFVFSRQPALEWDERDCCYIPAAYFGELTDKLSCAECDKVLPREVQTAIGEGINENYVEPDYPPGNAGNPGLP